MLKAFLEQGNIEQNREMLNTLAKSSNMSIERAIEIEEIIKEVNSVDEEKIVSLAKEIFREEYYSSTVLGEVNEEN